MLWSLFLISIATCWSLVSCSIPSKLPWVPIYFAVNPTTVRVSRDCNNWKDGEVLSLTNEKGWDEFVTGIEFWQPTAQNYAESIREIPVIVYSPDRSFFILTTVKEGQRYEDFLQKVKEKTLSSGMRWHAVSTTTPAHLARILYPQPTSSYTFDQELPEVFTPEYLVKTPELRLCLTITNP